uniref:Uncharacterized protein n=1 Tax=Rhizophora mucronata TaxID=61149 RepID=A0A2P2PH50_RHIMU
MVETIVMQCMLILKEEPTGQSLWLTECLRSIMKKVVVI